MEFGDMVIPMDFLRDQFNETHMFIESPGVAPLLR